MGLRERSDRLAASGASRAVEDWAPRSAAQRSAVQTARIFINCFTHSLLWPSRTKRNILCHESSNDPRFAKEENCKNNYG